MKLMIHLTPVEAIFEAEIWIEAGKVLKKEEKEEKEEKNSNLGRRKKSIGNIHLTLKLTKDIML